MSFLQGDVVEVSFDPSLGHEQRKARPAVVVSADDLNLRCSVAVVVPITSAYNGYPFHVRFDDRDEFYGFACVEQMRSLDLSARRARHIGMLSEREMSEILDLVGAVFGI